MFTLDMLGVTNAIRLTIRNAQGNRWRALDHGSGVPCRFTYNYYNKQASPKSRRQVQSSEKQRLLTLHVSIGMEAAFTLIRTAARSTTIPPALLDIFLPLGRSTG
jgi:hypothetical protein